jgi:hypothetical protein
MYFYMSIYWAVIFGLYSEHFIFFFYSRILVGVFPYILDRWQYSLLNVEQLRLLCVGLELGTMKSIICIGTLTWYAQVDIRYLSRHLWEGHEQISTCALVQLPFSDLAHFLACRNVLNSSNGKHAIKKQCASKWSPLVELLHGKWHTPRFSARDEISHMYIVDWCWSLKV